VSPVLVALALIADAILGDPEAVWRRAPHPVVIFGRIIDRLDAILNRDDRSAAYRRRAGILCLALLVGFGLAVGALLQSALLFLPFGWLVLVLFASVFLAQKSLYLHVEAVRTALRAGGLAAGRKAVSQIVGRDPDALDEAGISRAAIESCAENFSDGIVAPALWFALLGLPGLIAYKAINTADSMIGHRTPRFADFGWASARLDDLVNWPAARLAALFVAAGAALGARSAEPLQRCLDVCLADASKHRSPNAGWPEAAFAAALGIALAGPRVYGDRQVQDPFVNAAGRHDADAADISRALVLLRTACAVQIGFYLVLALVLTMF